jgi:hypothetical protein
MERRVSRVREAALCLDIMKTRSQETVVRSQKAKNAVGGTPTAGDRDGRGPWNAGATGLRWQEAVARHVFCRVGSGFYRIIYRILPPPGRFLPPVAAYYHILPHPVFFAPSEAWIQYGDGRTTETQWHGDRKRREVRSQKSEYGRKRDGTGESRADLRGTKCGLLREVSRKFAQIMAVVTRFHAFLRVGLNF